ncbi:tyrosine--tRNA ligase [Candidatus Dojkabacteria bacterium]|nr:tyrosine--tRNA ligase [Candidatus Dojkabacteria bacterium]
MKQNKNVNRWQKYFDMVKLAEPKMDVVTDEARIEEVLTRGVREIFPDKETLKKRMMSGERLRLYTGIDPTADFLHVGHFIWMRRLAKFQELGHQVIFLIGAFTAMIGDPDKQYTREPLTKKQVWKNFESYKSTAEKFINLEWKKNPVTILNNYDWLSTVTLEDWLQIMGSVTLQHLLSHDMFEKRLKENKPIRLHETMYPLMQGFDGVVMQVDLEQGGSDQIFNMLTGRILSKELIEKEKFVLANKLLEDTSGEKMGKTTGNAISSKDTPENMYGKIMSWSDDMIEGSFESLTDIDLKQVKKDLAEGKQMELKKKLAFRIVEMVNDEQQAQKAQEHFEKTVQKGELPEEMEELEYKGETNALEFAKLLVEKGFVVSNAEAKRLIQQGGIEVDGKRVDSLDQKLDLKAGSVVKIGKRRFIKIL